MNNTHLQYTSKDYNSIYSDLVSAIPSLTDSWTCTEEGDPGIVLVKLMSALGDMLSYNMDKQALEYYASTVTQRKNAAKLFELIGYKMHWYQSATNTISVTNIIKIPEIYGYINKIEYLQSNPDTTDDDWEQLRTDFVNKYNFQITAYKVYYDTEGNLKPTNKLLEELKNQYNYWSNSSGNVISINTQIDSMDRTLNVWGESVSNNPYIIKPTTYSNEKKIKPNETITLDVIQGSLCSTTFKINQLRDNKFFLSESSIDETNMWLKYTNNLGETVRFIPKTDNLLTITDGQVYFEFKIDEFDIPYIELSSYARDSLNIDNEASFVLYYVRTSGLFGNVTSNYLRHIESIPQSRISISHPANNSPYIDSNGYLLASPGQHPETASQAYINSINYVTTFNTLVTIFDFERFVKRQPGMSNCFAVDGQRALDLNEQVDLEGSTMSIAQLQAVIKGTVSEDIEELQELYANRKYVRYNDYNTGKPQLSDITKDDIKIIVEKNGIQTELHNSFLQSQLTTYMDNYINYGLNLHVVYGYFDTKISGNNQPVAILTNPMNNPGIQGYWSYQIYQDYSISESDTDSTYNTIETCSSISKYLDYHIDKCSLVNVQINYAPVRVFPWRCCGVLHLTQPVSSDTAEQIIQSVINNLRTVFHPKNLEFGKKIAYMDVINAVLDSSNMIRYFDAGLGDRKLIDLDKSVDDSYFNNTSLMYYYQTFENNNQEKDGDSDNPYYKLLSISPEYIIRY